MKSYRFLAGAILISAAFISAAGVLGIGVKNANALGDATLYFSPSSGRFSLGEEFWVDIMVNSGSEYVNAVAAYFSYPEDILKVSGISRQDSVMMIFSEQEYGNGIVKISGGKPTPGFAGINKIASVAFRSKEAGDASLNFVEDSAVLTNKDNINILNRSNYGGANFRITNDDKNFLFNISEFSDSYIASSFITPLVAIPLAILLIVGFVGFKFFVDKQANKFFKKFKLSK